MQTPNVIALLTADHKKVRKPFKEFDGLKDGNAAKRSRARGSSSATMSFSAR